MVSGSGPRLNALAEPDTASTTWNLSAPASLNGAERFFFAKMHPVLIVRIGLKSGPFNPLHFQGGGI